MGSHMVMKSLLRRLGALVITCCLTVSLLMVTWVPAAWAVTQIRLSDLQSAPCPAEIGEGSVASGSVAPANCYLITGKAENSSGKPVIDADVFGRIYDANGNSILQNRSRVGSIEAVPPGVSDFSIRISVAADQPGPLSLEKFKAAGFSSKVR